jgi:hypothetical protein
MNNPYLWLIPVAFLAAAFIIWGTHARMPHLRTRGRHHADSLGLAFDQHRGQWRHAETGPLQIAPGYGAEKAPRHAPTQPRSAPPWEAPRKRPAPAAPAAGPRTAPAPSSGPPLTSMPPAARESRQMHRASRPRRVYTTADRIGPVVVPRGATTVPYRPQPAADPHPETVTFGKVTDTGAMRAATSEYIAQMQQQEAAYRSAITSGDGQ